MKQSSSRPPLSAKTKQEIMTMSNFHTASESNANEIKDAIRELTAMMTAIAETGFMPAIARMLFDMKTELVKAGFSEDQAMQLVVAHGIHLNQK